LSVWGSHRRYPSLSHTPQVPPPVQERRSREGLAEHEWVPEVSSEATTQKSYSPRAVHDAAFRCHPWRVERRDLSVVTAIAAAAARRIVSPASCSRRGAADVLGRALVGAGGDDAAAAARSRTRTPPPPHASGAAGSMTT